MACNNLSAYQDFNKQFELHMNASEIQLGAFISKEVKTGSFYGINLTVPKKNVYRTINGNTKHRHFFQIVSNYIAISADKFLYRP